MPPFTTRSNCRLLAALLADEAAVLRAFVLDEACADATDALIAKSPTLAPHALYAAISAGVFTGLRVGARVEVRVCVDRVVVRAKEERPSFAAVTLLFTTAVTVIDSSGLCFFLS